MSLYIVADLSASCTFLTWTRLVWSGVEEEKERNRTTTDGGSEDKPPGGAPRPAAGRAADRRLASAPTGVGGRLGRVSDSPVTMLRCPPRLSGTNAAQKVKRN